MEENWKTIEGFEAYEISDLGRVRRVTIGRGTSAINGILKLGRNHKGYPIVYLSINSKKYTKLVHRLVAKAFVPNPLGLSQVNHKNGDKTTGSALNLEWRSQTGNMHHSVQMGLHGKDISKRSNNGKWRVRFSPEPHKRISAGEYNTKEEAEKALKEAIESLPYVP